MSGHVTALFGIAPEKFQKTCIIMPFDIPRAARNLGVAAMTQGRVFSCGQGQGFTLIRSGMGAGFVGDCTLYLAETPCEKILFLGTCGLIRRRDNLDVGSLVIPGTIHAFESFSAIVKGTLNTSEPVQADETLTRTFPCPRQNCVSFASLHEEEKHIALFDQLDARIIEMECSAFFLACRKIGRASGALLVVADILQEKVFCAALPSSDKKSLTEGISQACSYLKKIV